MSLRTVLVSGPRRSGKSTVIRCFLTSWKRCHPHFIRLASKGIAGAGGRDGFEGGEEAELTEFTVGDGLASRRIFCYDENNIFVEFPVVLGEIHGQDRNGLVVLESNADPVLRYSYSYDFRIFVIPLPSRVYEVFRTPEEAAQALKELLKDTMTFATEFFGVQEDGETPEPSAPREERVDLSSTQWRGLLYSPLGEELATRMQLQTDYHGLLESDLVIINSGLGKETAQTQSCIDRLDSLLGTLHRISGRRTECFVCNVLEDDDLVTRHLLKTIGPLAESNKG